MENRDNFDQWKVLDEEGQLTFLLGRVVRSSALLDGATRELFAELKGLEPETRWDAPRAMETRIKKLHGLIDTAPEFDNDDVAIAHQVIADASATYLERNRYVHDILMLIESGQNALFMARLDRATDESVPIDGHSTFPALVECHVELRRSAWKIFGVRNLVESGRHDAPSTRSKKRWRALASGQFTWQTDDTVSWSS